MRTFIAAGALALLAACAPAPARLEAPLQAPAPAEEPLPAHWVGAFTMVEGEDAPRGRGQFRLRLGQDGPNRFEARRGCYVREGELKRRGSEWLVESTGVRADPDCLADPAAFKGSAEGLFDHRAITLSPPGGRWIGEGGARWFYLANPAAPPRPASLDLFGEWQVASLESARLSAQDRRIGDPTRIAVLIGPRMIEASSQCIPYFFEHSREGNEGIRIAEARWPNSVCARGLAPFEAAFAPVMVGATRLEQPAPGIVRLSGPSGAVTLRRPAEGLIANPFGSTPAPGGELWGHYRIVDVAGVAPPPDQAIDVALGRLWIEARSGCIPFRWRIVRGPNDWTLREDWPEPVCQRGRHEAEKALERTMPSVRRMEWAAPYRLRLVGDGGTITLERVGSGG